MEHSQIKHFINAKIDLFTLKNSKIYCKCSDSKLNFALSETRQTTEFFLANFIYFFALWSSGERRCANQFLPSYGVLKKTCLKHENKIGN